MTQLSEETTWVEGTASLDAGGSVTTSSFHLIRHATTSYKPFSVDNLHIPSNGSCDNEHVDRFEFFSGSELCIVKLLISGTSQPLEGLSKLDEL